MTTTQTGSGNGAAPDGGTEQQAPRIPTRPGWWFVETDEGSIEAMEICEFGGVLKYVTALGVGHVDQDDLAWLAPIPGPAVCAALENCVMAEQAWASGDLDDERLERAVGNAEARLYAAIRAERDGAA